MNISHFRFILFNLKTFGEIVTTNLLTEKRSSPEIEVFFPKPDEEQNIYTLKGCVSGHVLSVKNAEKQDIWAFFKSSEDKLFFTKKEKCPPKRGGMVTYLNPKIAYRRFDLRQYDVRCDCNR